MVQRPDKESPNQKQALQKWSNPASVPWSITPIHPLTPGLEPRTLPQRQQLQVRACLLAGRPYLPFPVSPGSGVPLAFVMQVEFPLAESDFRGSYYRPLSPVAGILLQPLAGSNSGLTERQVKGGWKTRSGILGLWQQI
jgi:hypothetical protein